MNKTYKLGNNNISIALKRDSNFLQDWRQFLAVTTPRGIKLQKDCKGGQAAKLYGSQVSPQVIEKN
jgi:hypothetical protein